MTYDWNKQVEITVPTGTNGWIYSGEVIINGVKVRFPVGVPTTVPEPAAALLNKMIELEREDENNTAKPDNHYVGSVTIPEGKTLTLQKGAKIVDENNAPVVILPETEFPVEDGSAGITTPWSVEPVAGGVYSVKLDGASYECAGVACNFGGAPAIAMGNSESLSQMGIADAPENDAPFVLICNSNENGASVGFYGVCILSDDRTSVTLSIVEAAKTESAGGGGRFTFNGTIASEPKEQNGSTMTFDVTFDKEYSEVEKAWNDGQSVFCAIDMGLLSDGEEHAGYYAYLPVITYDINTNEIVCALNFNGYNLVAWIYPDTAQNQLQMTLTSA